MGVELVYLIAMTVVALFTGTFGYLIGQCSEASRRLDSIRFHRERR